MLFKMRKGVPTTIRDDGTSHEVRNMKDKDCILANELCEMFLDFMQSAGYSEENVFKYFNEDK